MEVLGSVFNTKTIEGYQGRRPHAGCLAETLAARNLRVVTGGTDNHQVLLDLTPRSMQGGTAESLLESVCSLTNRNIAPADALQTGRVSGLRLGTAAVTIRGSGNPIWQLSRR